MYFCFFSDITAYLACHSGAQLKAANAESVNRVLRNMESGPEAKPVNGPRFARALWRRPQ
jgi:hypothetical protein